MEGQFSAVFLWVLVGGIVSLIADYVPKFNTWFTGLVPNAQRAWMAGFLLLTSAALVALSCYEATATILVRYVVIECDKGGILAVVEVFVFALIGNQATFLITPSKK
jgi:hypothetical protein